MSFSSDSSSCPNSLGNMVSGTVDRTFEDYVCAGPGSSCDTQLTDLALACCPGVIDYRPF